MAKSRRELAPREPRSDWQGEILRSAQNDNSPRAGSPRGREQCLARAEVPRQISSLLKGEDEGEGERAA
jgi:hypothetical protein